MLHDRKTLFIFLLILIFITACATTSKTGGVYHNVKKGETLWRIARAYNCDPDEIARANNLPDTTIEAGSALFIPNAKEPIP
ncbi:MAG: LysM peptidoglycan-binding domain-containing protein, partial [Deltaproteobacteria bacterium]|nr:LysM peptidoglycan-binding domain-containing protein [Deltaproteobacteria bacterium]